MTIVIILIAFAILLGLGGSVILVLGLTGKKNGMIVSGGLMLLFTILFCAGAVFCSARPMDKNQVSFYHARTGIPPMHPRIDMQNPKDDEYKPMMKAPKGQPCDSICEKTGKKEHCPEK